MDRSDSLFTVLKVVELNFSVDNSLKIPTCSVFKSTVSPMDSNDFFRSEQLCTTIEPKCGSCRCGRCPIPGSRYSFREEVELKLIDDNLHYDNEAGKWIASYPYLFPKESLLGTKDVALRSMVTTERMLLKNKDWGSTYQARVVPKDEFDGYSGHVNFLPHLAVSNPRSASTPVRICFDASRSQGGGPGFNKVLAKGPDRFLNNLAGVILRFRNGVEAAKGDVSKMYNAVGLAPEDCFIQCFLWRDLDVSADPLVYQVVVNNIGVKPAGCIATLALYKSADHFQEKYPATRRQLKDNSYVDDLGLTGKNRSELKKRTQEADEILAHANMKIRSW